MPVDLVVDHSVQVDYSRSQDALQKNAEIEFERNRERYEFLRWGQHAFDELPSGAARYRDRAPGEPRVPRQGRARHDGLRGDRRSRCPDTLVGTDSHTTMINGLGVLGWGVGGIEAEAAMLGQPLYMVTPQVVGFRLTGKLREGVTATDLVLTVTQMLRKKGVVEKFVEFFGPGLAADDARRPRHDREHGARVRRDLRLLPGRRRDALLPPQDGPQPTAEVDLVERYAKEQGLFRTAATPDPVFTDTLALDLASVEPSLAGPKRPQDRVPSPR